MLLDEDPKFEIRIVVIPLVRDGQADMDVFHKTLNYFQRKGYRTLSSYDPEKKTWLDIKKITQPDIVFFTNPHKLTFEKYYLNNFIDRLTCYVPYAFVVIHSIHIHYNQKIHHSLWRYFIETKFHMEFSRKYIKDSSNNVVVTGFPGLDSIFSKNYKPSTPWKSYLNKTAKKIIWAPHHTIKGEGSGLDYSSFEEYSDFFITLLENTPNIQIAFKPHPLLKEKLYRKKDWGKDKNECLL